MLRPFTIARDGGRRPIVSDCLDLECMTNVVGRMTGTRLECGAYEVSHLQGIATNEGGTVPEEVDMTAAQPLRQ